MRKTAGYYERMIKDLLVKVDDLTKEEIVKELADILKDE